MVFEKSLFSEEWCLRKAYFLKNVFEKSLFSEEWCLRKAYFLKNGV